MAVTQFAVCGVLGLLIAFAFESFDWSAVRIAAPEILYTGIFSGGARFHAAGSRPALHYCAPSRDLPGVGGRIRGMFGIWLFGERLPPQAFSAAP